MVFRSLWLNQDQTQKIPGLSRRPDAADSHKKTDVAENPKVIDHVGLLFNEPPGIPGCSLFSHPTSASMVAPHQLAPAHQPPYFTARRAKRKRVFTMIPDLLLYCRDCRGKNRFPDFGMVFPATVTFP